MRFIPVGTVFFVKNTVISKEKDQVNEILGSWKTRTRTLLQLYMAASIDASNAYD